MESGTGEEELEEELEEEEVLGAGGCFPGSFSFSLVNCLILFNMALKDTFVNCFLAPIFLARLAEGGFVGAGEERFTFTAGVGMFDKISFKLAILTVISSKMEVDR